MRRAAHPPPKSYQSWPDSSPSTSNTSPVPSDTTECTPSPKIAAFVPLIYLTAAIGEDISSFGPGTIGFRQKLPGAQHQLPWQCSPYSAAGAR